MSKICGIYKIISPSGKIYIGQSVHIERRFREYRKLECKKQHKLLRSFLKYTVESHLFEIIEHCSIEELNIRERYWQEHYEVLLKGLNCKLTNCTDKKGRLSDEVKKRISDSNKGKQDLRGDKNPMFGRKHSEETKEKIRQNKPDISGKNNPMYGKTSAMKGRHHSEETKNKLKELFSGGRSWAAKKVIDTATGIIYEATTVAAIALGINKYTLRRYLSGTLKNKTTLEYYKEDEKHDTNS